MASGEENKVKVLFLAANPHDTSRLQLGKEFNKIDSELRQSKYRDQFDLEQSHGVSVSELQELMLRHDPHIVHFSGHGAEEGALIFEHRSGFSEELKPEALSELFKIVNRENHIRCIVLDSCYSEIQANEIVKYVDCVVGMPKAVTDQAAAKFSASFYRALGYGKNLADAFELGKNELKLLGMPEEDLPQIKSRKDPAKIVLARRHDNTHRKSVITIGDRSIRREILIAVIAGPLATIIALAWPAIGAYMEDASARSIVPISIPEDCEPFSPQAVAVQQIGQDWKIVDSESGFQMLDFKANKANAEEGAEVIKSHGFNEICFVGRPYNPVSNPVLPLMYFLVNETAPRDIFNEQGCVQINPEAISTRKVGDSWYVLEGNTRIYDFGGSSKSRENADRAAQILNAHGFSKICSVERPIQPMTYYLTENTAASAVVGLPGFTNYFIVKNDAGLILQVNGDNTANDAGASASLDPVSDCPPNNATTAGLNNSTSDDTYPRVTIDYPEDDDEYPEIDVYLGVNTFEVNGTTVDDGLNMARVEVQVDNGPLVQANPRATNDWSFWSTTITTGDGQHMVLARAQDMACLSDRASVPVWIDTIDPMIGFTSHSSNADVASREFTVRGYASDAGTGLKSLQFRVDNGDYDDLSVQDQWSRQVIVSSDGEHTLYARAVDKANNFAERAITLNVQLTPPPNQPPNAYAGADFTVQSGQMVTLDGSGSGDAEGDIAQYYWSRISGPAVSLSGFDTAQPHFTAPYVEQAQEIQLRLLVTDEEGLEDTDTIQVRIIPLTQPLPTEEDEAQPFTISSELDGRNHWLEGEQRGASASSFEIEPEDKLIRLNLESVQASNDFTISLSNDMISGIHTIKTDTGAPVDFDALSDANGTTVTFSVPDGTAFVEISGATVVPEFPILVTLAGAVIGETVIVNRKFRP